MPGVYCDCYTFTLTSWNPLGHARSVMGLLYLYLNFLEPYGTRQVCNGTVYFYLYFLEPSGSRQACNGTDLLLP